MNAVDEYLLSIDKEDYRKMQSVVANSYAAFVEVCKKAIQENDTSKMVDALDFILKYCFASGYRAAIASCTRAVDEVINQLAEKKQK